VIGAPCNCAYPAIDTAHLFLGNSDGVAFAPRQSRSSGGPLFALGNAGAGTYRIQMYGRSPEGRALVRMEYEVRQFVQAFDAAEASATDWFDTGDPVPGAMGYAFDKTVTLTGYGQFKWRARISSRNPFFPHSRWFSIPANGPEEEDLVRLP